MNIQSDREYDNYRSDESDSKYQLDKKMTSQNNTIRKVNKEIFIGSDYYSS